MATTKLKRSRSAQRTAGSLKRVVRRRWRGSYEKPKRRGWYECKARDNRWNGEIRWRAWGQGMWWIPLGKGDGEDGWLSSPMGIYKWRGPAHDIMLPPPNDKVSDGCRQRAHDGKANV